MKLRYKQKSLFDSSFLVDGIVIFSVTFLLFLPALYGAFQLIWDDKVLLLTNTAYQGLSSGHLRWMASSTLVGHWQPLTWLSYALDYKLYGLNPAGFHLTNVLLHASNAVVFYCIVRWFLTEVCSPNDVVMHRYSAIIATLFFSMHPLRVEVVAWVATRGYLLCSFFVLLSLLLYLRAIPRRYPWGALLCFTIATLSKGIGMMLPLVFLVLDACPLRRISSVRRFFRCVIEKIPFFALTLIEGGAAFWAKLLDGGMVNIEDRGCLERVGQATYNFWFYLWKVLLPTHLSPFYHTLPSFRDEMILVTVGILFLMLYIFGRNRPPWIITSFAVYGILIFPMLGITQSGVQVAADRFSYLAVSPFSICLAVWLFNVRGERKKYLWMALWVGISVLGIQTIKQTVIWRNDVTLWSWATKLTPSNILANNNLTCACIGQGIPTVALEPILRATRNEDPEVASQAHDNLGLLYSELGLFDMAIDSFTRGIELNPLKQNECRSYYNRAVTYFLKTETDRSLDELEWLINNPSLGRLEKVRALGFRAMVFLQIGDVCSAADDYRIISGMNGIPQGLNDVALRKMNQVLLRME